jgi:hypothetical protein
VPRTRGPLQSGFMKRFLLLVVFAIVILFLVLFALRRNAATAASAAPSILPSDTVLFLHVPDPAKNRENWHKTELYALYREPAVQKFLRKPAAKISKNNQVSQAWSDLGTLRLRDVFVATNTFDSLRLVAGFEFQCDKKQAESIIEGWKSNLTAKAPRTQRSAVDYEKHSIDVIKGDTAIASTFVGNRFFAASNVDDLKALLDRIDHRTKTPALESDENFRAAMKEMPTDYAWLFYVQPRQFAQKLAALRSQDGRRVPPDQQTMLERIQSFSHAMIFEGAKIRDVEFVAMPKLFDAQLTRETLAMTSAETFLYIASLLNLEQQIDWIQQGTGGTPATPFLRQINSALATAGVTPDDWKAAFSNEISLTINWAANSRVPSGVATLALRDSARANKMVNAVTAAWGWHSTSRNNAQYYTAPTEGNLLAINPTLAMNDRFLVLGLDSAGVDRAIAPPTGVQPLTATDKFKSGSNLVPAPHQMFIYLDLANLYARLDTTVRPILQMSAAFIPALTKEVDIANLPEAETVTRHLSPVVASQSYAGHGYRSESVGTITVTQTAALAAMGWVGTMTFKSRSGTASPNFPQSSATPSPPTNNPSPTP